jgi:hypothetical protein
VPEETTESDGCTVPVFRPDHDSFMRADNDEFRVNRSNQQNGCPETWLKTAKEFARMWPTHLADR